jgi:hypothetical protein
MLKWFEEQRDVRPKIGQYISSLYLECMTRSRTERKTCCESSVGRWRSCPRSRNGVTLSNEHQFDAPVAVNTGLSRYTWGNIRFKSSIFGRSLKTMYG